MQKQAPTVGRLGTMVLFGLSCFGLLTFLWLSFGGTVPLKPKGYRFNVGFSQAVSLAPQSDVRMAGINVGRVVSVNVDRLHPNVSVAMLELSPRYAPLRTDALAILRQKTLLGETYVELTPGTPRASPVPDGGWLRASQVRSNVYVDQVLQAFDPVTRQAFRNWQQDVSVAANGQGLNLNDAFGNLPQFATDLTSVLKVLDDQNQALSLLVRNTGVVFGALNRNTVQLHNLVVNTGSVFQTTSDVQNALAEVFHQFPRFEDESKSTFQVTQAFSQNTDPLVKNLIPVAKDLVPTLSDLRQLAPDLRQLFINTDPLVTASETGLPALRDLLNQTTPLLGALDPFLEQLNPALQFIELYQLMTSQFISHPATGLVPTIPSAPPQLGHYLRGVAPSGPEGMTVFSQRAPTNRGNAYVGPNTLQGHFLTEHLIFPTFDCNNTGAPGNGEMNPNPGNGQPGSSAPGCTVDLPYSFQGASTKFAHVHADNYGP